MDTSGLPSAADALRSLNSFQTIDSATALGQAQQKYGVNDLSTKVANLNTLTGNLTNAIAAVDPSVTGRTAGSLVTEGQRSALVARERAPVVGQLGTANQSLGLAKDEYNTADSKSRSEADSVYRDNQDKYTKLKTTYELANAREEAARQAAAEAEARRQAQANADREFSLKQQELSQSASNRASSAAASAGNGFKVKQLSSGNYAFTDAHGSPVSMYQYSQATGSSMLDILKNSKSSYDKQAYKDAVYWLQKGGESLALGNLQKKYGKLF